MTEYGRSQPSSESADGAGAARQRKKSKWDQPAQALISAGFTIPVVGPSNGMPNLSGMILPAAALLPGAILTNSVPASGASVFQMLQAPIVQQSATSLVQKGGQIKIQDELIAREIVINDADPAIRYKLTKRQTQEEIQKSTGAIVITRGKYIPPNVQATTEKPLYLHISAASHLKDVVERIKAVDHAALLVEEILKQGQGHNSHQISIPTLSGVNSIKQVDNPLTACLYLGFEAIPSVNIVARIRGPNDQYINHIMNETGANVVLRGGASGNADSQDDEDGQQPLHLFLSSNNVKSLEAAKLLAENLLDTISMECGASRVSSSKVYGAVPPPQQLLDGVQSNDRAPVVVPAAGSAINHPLSVYPSPMSNFQQPPPSMVTHQAQFPGLGGTSYNGYGGIYPQATPLQQVALALRQAAPSATAAISTLSTAASAPPRTSSCMTASTKADKRPPPKRKFQELPKAINGSLYQVFSLTFYEVTGQYSACVGTLVPLLHTICISSRRDIQEFVAYATELHNLPTGSEFVKPDIISEDPSTRDFSLMPPPKKLVQLDSNGMQPPPRSRPPPPPPKFTSPTKSVEKKSALKAPVNVPVSDILAKLVEYGEEDDDAEDPPVTQTEQHTVAKPFWAV